MAGIPSSRLRQFDNAEKTKFMKKVYELHCNSSKRKRTYQATISEGLLSTIEDDHQAITKAASTCVILLEYARAELQVDKDAKVTKAVKTLSIGIASAYRSAEKQFRNWRNNFEKYYNATKESRKDAAGGKHGSKAAQILRSYIAQRLAAPGYSLHNSGIAIDFSTKYRGSNLGPSTSQRAAWKKSWFFLWMKQNAAEYHFHLNPLIDEPWHWEYGQKCRPQTHSEDETLCCALDQTDADFDIGRAQMIRSKIAAGPDA